MFTVLIAGISGCIVCVGLGSTGCANWIWAPVWGGLTFLTVQFSIGFLMQKKMRTIAKQVESIMKECQRHIQKKVQAWQTRPPGGIKQAQDEIAREQRKFIDAALAATNELERFRRWVPMMDRQLATMRLQLYWMNKDFKKVDACMEKAVFFDPMMVCMRMARLYTRGKTDELEKIFRKAVRRTAYGKGVMLYALYSWILVKQNRLDDAHRILIEGCEKSENQTLKNNRECLANNRVAHFSNAGFGDEWYALLLEEPKIRMQRQPQRFGRPF